ncbi:hypothetical protein GCM10009678_50000 [Actinomadura kijaniata]
MLRSRLRGGGRARVSRSRPRAGRRARRRARVLRAGGGRRDPAVSGSLVRRVRVMRMAHVPKASGMTGPDHLTGSPTSLTERSHTARRSSGSFSSGVVGSRPAPGVEE